ncbi:MAG: PepSY-associated TM helix domain-containing protein [Gemmatimonadota bacterium]
MPVPLALRTLPRRILFWTHLVAGVTASVIILVMSVSGVLLTYERQMIAAADLRAVVPRGAPTSASADATGPRRPLGELIRAARTALPEASPTSVQLSADPAAPVQVSFGREGSVYVDPTRATVLGRGDRETRDVFDSITGWHRWLGASTEGRATARTITGVANLAFLCLVLSGLVLWFPRRLTRPQLRAVTWFRRGLRAKARDFNWHNVVGIWSFVPLVLIASSGAVISYSWAVDLLYRVAGDAPPSATPRNAAPPAPVVGDPRVRGDGAPSISLEHLDGLVTTAATRLADWHRITIALPTDVEAPVNLVIDRGTGGQPQRRATLRLDPATGREVAWVPFDSLTRGLRARSFMRYAHTGEYFGIFGQTVAGLVTLATTLLVWTGLALAWRRLIRRDRTERPRESLERAA